MNLENVFSNLAVSQDYLSMSSHVTSLYSYNVFQLIHHYSISSVDIDEECRGHNVSIEDMRKYFISGPLLYGS